MKICFMRHCWIRPNKYLYASMKLICKNYAHPKNGTGTNFFIFFLATSLFISEADKKERKIHLYSFN